MCAPQKLRRVWITGLKWIYTQSHTHTQTYIIMNAISEKRRRNYKVLKLKAAMLAAIAKASIWHHSSWKLEKERFAWRDVLLWLFIYETTCMVIQFSSHDCLYIIMKKRMLLVQRPKLSIPHLPLPYLLISRHIAILFVCPVVLFLLPYTIVRFLAKKARFW